MTSLPKGQRAAVLSLVLLAIAAYIQTITYDFVYDDFRWVVDNPSIRSLENVPRFFASGHLGGRLYRPLTATWYALDYAVAGTGPLLYHLENVLLHALVVVLVYFLLRRFAGDTAWLAAAIFAVAPVHTEVVANVTSRAEMFAAALALLALLQLKRPLLATCLLFLGLLAKETAVAVPALAVLLWWREVERPSLKRALITMAPFCAAIAAFTAAMYAALGHIRWPKYAYMQVENPLALVDWSTRVATALMIVAQNLVISLVPYHLSADYSHPQIELVTSWWDLRFVFWAGMLVAAVAIGWLVRWRVPNITLGLAWFLVAIFPVSNLLLVIGTIRGERLLYLPSVGTSLVLAEVIALIAARAERWRPASPVLGLARWRTVLASGAILAFAITTVARNPVWRNTETIVKATAQDAPNSARARFDLGNLYASKGDCARATVEYERTLKLYPKFTQAFMGLAQCRQAAGDIQGAVASLRAAVQAEPGDRELALELARFCSHHEDWNCAATTVRRLLESNPHLQSDPELWRQFAVATARAGDASGAEHGFRRAIALAAQPVDHVNLAGTLARMARWQEAVAAYQSAERLGVRLEAMYIDWSGALRSAGRIQEARDVAVRGLREHPGSAQLRALASRK